MATTEDRLTRLEAEQAGIHRDLGDHAAWLRSMRELTAEVWQLHRETQKEMQATQQAMQATQESAQQFRQESQKSLEEFGRQAQIEMQATQQAMRATEESLQATQDEVRKTGVQQQETARMIQDLRKEMGALGQKFGGFAEGMTLPSMERRLAERFGTTGFMARVRKRLDDREIELDALAYANGDARVACVVEVKSRLRDDGIDQLLRALDAFPRFFPEHRGKKLFGVLAAVDAPDELRRRVLREGLVLATIRDDVFELQVPEDFEPRAFPNDGASTAAPAGDTSGAA